MTPNEKAATFIGWKPGMRATSWENCPMHCGCNPPVDRQIIHQPHDIPAPDMSRPENCWLLLEALLTRDSAIDFGVSADVTEGWDNYVRLDLTCINDKWDFFKHLGRGHDFRSGLIELVAEFYDAEHPQSAEAHT